MTDQPLILPLTLPAGQIVAIGVSAQEYLDRYAEHHHEWVKGAVIKTSPESLHHALLIKYLLELLDACFALNPIGVVLDDPFVMRLDALDVIREPDVMVVLNENGSRLTETAVVGPADVCIEVVSQDSTSRDYGDKFREYEAAGVREYWLVDPLRQRCDFNRLTDDGVYAVVDADETGSYRTPLLPRFVLQVPILWRESLPNVVEIVAEVQAMFEDDQPPLPRFL